MSKKRHREQPTVDAQVVEIYEDLANESEEIRLKAAQSLLSKSAYENSPSGEQLDKTLSRLIRGLCSGRKAARLGFSVALTELLIQLLGPSRRDVEGFSLSVVGLIRLLEEQTRVTGNVSGQEERDHHFGRLFGAEAIIKSEIIFQPDIPIEDWSHLLDIIYNLAKKKPSLREECGWILYSAVQRLDAQNASSSYVQTLVDKLHSNGLTKSPEGVAIWIGVRMAHQLVNLPKGVWHRENPLHQKENTTLAKILKEATTAEAPQHGASKITQKGTWNSKLHFAWDTVLASLLFDSGLDRSQCITFQDFWIETVDNGLFAASSSEERKYWGFLLFQRYFLIIPRHLLATIFSKNFLRCLINQLSSQERYLHRIAEKAMKVIHSRVEKEPQIAPVVIMALMGPSVQINFDFLTKTKTVEKLLACVQVDALIDTVIPFFTDLLLHPRVNDETVARTRRQQIADQMVAIVRSIPSTREANAASATYHDAISTILAPFVKLGFFQIVAQEAPINRPEPPISNASRQMFQSRISSCLTHLISRTVNPASHPYDIVCAIRHHEQVDDETKSVFEADDSIRKVMHQAWKILDTLHAKEHSAPVARKSYIHAFELLYSLTILQVYSGDADAVSLLDELKQCYDSLVRHKSKDGREGGSEVLTEILLTLVSKPSLLFRRLAQQVFSACTSSMTVNGLQSMFKVLETKESILGQGEMFDQVDSDKSDGEMSDVEEFHLASGDGVSSTSEHDADELSANSESEVEDLDDTDDELAAFDAKLAQALGTRRADQDLVADDDVESTDEDMDDEQMEALDEHLEKVFLERKKVKSKKNEKKEAKETVVNFKCRVLELLEIYIKQQYADALALDIILPLLNLIRSTTSKQVAEKACKLLREYSRLCKGRGLSKPGDGDKAFGLLQQVHLMAMKEGSNAYGNACSQASILMAKLLAALDRENLRRVVSMYATTQEHFLFDSHCKVKTSFFSDWLNWCTSARKSSAS